jgi:hypothetical protein
MAKKLIPMMDTMVSGKLGDEFLAIAHTIETSLMDSGAVPGQDYNILDLYKLAQPFVLDSYKKDELDFFYPTSELLPKNEN